VLAPRCGRDLESASGDKAAVRTLTEPQGKAAWPPLGARPSSRTYPWPRSPIPAGYWFSGGTQAVSEQLAHKSDAGGVVLNVRDPAQATAAGRAWRIVGYGAREQMIDDGVMEVLSASLSMRSLA